MGYLVNKYPTQIHWSLVFILAGLLLVVPSALEPGLQAAPFPDEDLIVGGKAEVSIIYDQQMDFGQLADNDGAVTLGLSDSIINDPDFIFYGGSPYSGIFTITGDPDTAVDVSISSSSSDGFTLSSFFSSEGALPLVGVMLSPAGELILTVGATLTLDEIQASVGSGQSISFTITSTYN